MSQTDLPRREALLVGLGAALLMPAGLRAEEQKGPAVGQEKPVGAVEDLMREHGILRRIMMVYLEVIPQLEKEASGWDVDAVYQAAQLFRRFGEDYHETRIEEGNIFPAMRTAAPSLIDMTQILQKQHAAGRAITDHILGALGGGKVKTGQAKPLAKQLRDFIRMYGNHAAREDTILFPAWKKSLSSQTLGEMSEKFDGIEKQTFGTDGFDDAATKISDIEGRLGLSSLDKFTAPAPVLK